MTTEVTTKATKRELQQSNRERIQQILGWSDYRYCEYQMEQGYAWLQHHIAGDEYGMKMLTSNAIFWKWWINHWNKRDFDYLLCIDEVGAENMHVESEYGIYHSVKRMQNKPHRVIMEACYAKMMGELIDAERRAL